MDLALQVSSLDVTYQGVLQVLQGLSLRVPRGQVVALLGSNGAGKTTTLKAVTGLLPLEKGAISGGKVMFDGRDTTRLAPHLLARRGLYHVREGRQLFTDMTVEENLIAACNALGGRHAPPKDFDEVYGYFPPLRARARDICGYLSGGEQQMLAIGRALVARPALIVLDEPSLGLAPKVVAEIFATLRHINRSTGVSMLVVEQNARVALAHDDHAYILEAGRIVLEGPAAELADNPEVKSFYLGGASAAGGRKSFRDVKHYRAAKRWLS
ncbi:MAG: ABC transporter ATP-binding protein [Burkholderiales bacterium]|nr:ABC transporter ATP-binding protein [Burkholderiales bacterium]